MDSTGPVRNQSDLAEMVELLLEKGVVINADIVVSVGDTELLGVELRAAIASFETAAKYGLEFPEGTDEERVIEAANQSGEIDAGSTEELPADSSDASSTKARSLSLRPGGPATSGGSDETVGGSSSVADTGTSEADRKTPAGAEDVTIDPAPYDSTRADYDPDADEPGVEHPDVDDSTGQDTDGDTPDGDGSAEADAAPESGAEGADGGDGDGAPDSEMETEQREDDGATDADAESAGSDDGGGGE